MKNKRDSVEYEEIFDMIEGILIYLAKGDKDECTTNQCLIGMRCLFRGHPLKVWREKQIL